MRFSTIFQPVMGRVKAKLIQYGVHLIQLTQEEATGSNDFKFLLNMKKKKTRFLDDIYIVSFTCQAQMKMKSISFEPHIELDLVEMERMHWSFDEMTSY